MLSVYPRPAPKRIAPGQQWFRSIEHVAMPSPHRRAVDACSRAGSQCDTSRRIPAQQLSES